VLMARKPQRPGREWLVACDAYLNATLAHAKYLMATGRLADPESANDVAILEEEHRQIRLQLDRLPGEPAARVRFPLDPARRLSVAARWQLRCYREVVCEDSRRLRAHSAALVRRSLAARTSRAGRQLRIVSG
jgi:hypothetical protein